MARRLDSSSARAATSRAWASASSARVWAASASRQARCRGQHRGPRGRRDQLGQAPGRNREAARGSGLQAIELEAVVAGLEDVDRLRLGLALPGVLELLDEVVEVLPHLGHQVEVL